MLIFEFQNKILFLKTIKNCFLKHFKIPIGIYNRLLGLLFPFFFPPSLTRKGGSRKYLWPFPKFHIKRWHIFTTFRARLLLLITIHAWLAQFRRQTSLLLKDICLNFLTLSEQLQKHVGRHIGMVLWLQ